MARALARPDKNFYEELNSGEFEARLRDTTAALPYSLHLQSRFVNPGLEGISFVDLDMEYTRLISFKTETGCFFYETEYTAIHEFMKTQQLADIAGFYRAFGLVVAENQQRPDYIATELEFMHFLAFKEARSSYQGEKAKSELCLDAQKKFLRDHLGRWLPAFRQGMETSSTVGFYRELTKLAESFVDLDASYLGVRPKPLLKPPPAPRYTEDTGGCPVSDGNNCPVDLQLSGGNGFDENR